MNKKNNRKGFTTVELVIVIAVIAILATVLIPTFSTLINDANESAALQEANNIFKSYFIDKATDGTTARDFVIKVVRNNTTYYFDVDGGELVKEPIAEPTAAGTIIVTADSVEPYYIEATVPATQAP